MHVPPTIFARNGVTGTMLESATQFPRHTHDSYGLGLIETGAQKSWSGRGLVEAEAGDIITVNPGEVHDGAPMGSMARRWRMLYLAPRLLAETARDLSEGCSEHYDFAAPVFHPTGELAKIFLQLFVQAAAAGDTAEMAQQQGLLILAKWLGTTARKEQPRFGRITRAKNAIDDAPEQRFSLDMLARETGLSKYHFLRAFVQATGLTPHAYIVQRRLAKARALVTGGTTIAEAAAAAGFSDQAHFTRHFHRCYGFSPGRLRCGSAISFKKRKRGTS